MCAPSLLLPSNGFWRVLIASLCITQLLGFSWILQSFPPPNPPAHPSPMVPRASPLPTCTSTVFPVPKDLVKIELKISPKT